MKKSELRQLIKEEISEWIFNTSFDKEKIKIKDAIDRWVKYSMENGDNEADVMSVGEKYLRDAIDVYRGITNN